MPLLLRVMVVLLCLTGAAFAQTFADRSDPRLAEALDLADDGDPAAAGALAQEALAHAISAEAAWAAQETLAMIAHWAGEDDTALALLAPLLDDGARLFGPDSPDLIAALRMQGASLSFLGRDAEALPPLVRAVRLARGNDDDPETLLLSLGDLARTQIDLGLNDAAALTAADLHLRALYDDGGESPLAEEAAALRALAHLRMGHAVEAALHALPLYRRADALAPDSAGLLAQLDAELAEAEDAEGLFDAALARESTRAAQDQALTDAMLPVMAALNARDAVQADSAARTALQTVLADDVLVVNTYLALLSATVAAERPDLALAWAGRVAGIAPSYLATLPNDPVPLLRRVIEAAQTTGNLAAAKQLAGSALTAAVLRAGEAAPDALRLRLVLADLHRSGGEWEEADALLRQTAALLAPLPPEGDVARFRVQVLVDQARLAEDRGAGAAAEAAYSDAIALLQTTDAGQDSAGWAFVLGQLGALYASDGRLAEAESLIRQALALDLARGGEASGPVAMTLYDLARVQIHAGDIDAAVATADRALAAGRAALPPQDPHLLSLLTLRANVLSRAGHPDADAAMAEALAQNAAAGRASGTGFAALLLTQAVQITSGGNGAGAEMAQGRALLAKALAALPEEDPYRSEVVLADGAMALMQGDLNAALGRFREATAELTQPGRRDQPGARDHLPMHADTALRLSETAAPSEALALAAEAFAVAQRVNDLSAGAALSRAAARLTAVPALEGAEPLPDLARRIEAAERGMAEARSALLNRLAAGADASAERSTLQARRAEVTAMQQRLDAAYPRFAAYASPRPQDLLATSRLLRPDEVLVLFATSDITGFGEAAPGSVIAVTREGHVAAPLPPRAEVEAVARALRCAAARTDPACRAGGGGATRGAFSLDAPEPEADFDFALAHQAWETLLEPVSAALHGKSALIVVPDKALAALPFHLMLTAPHDGGLREAPWLIRALSVTVLPTVASLGSLRGEAARPSAASAPFLGIGDPLIGAQRAGARPYDCAAPPDAGIFAAALAAADTPLLRGADAGTLAGLAALPETRCELADTAQLLGTPGAVLLQADATETRLKAMSEAGDLMRYRVLSFATHGLIAGEIGPHDAGLVLTPPARPDAQNDGLLTTAEIAGLRLDADFVLLSACNTAAGAAGRDEGLSGLASAFFLAGARSLLVSHWPVYSDAATRLTTTTFRTLAADPATGRAGALRQAMLAVLDDPGADAAMLHPGWWGAFMIVGEGAP